MAVVGIGIPKHGSITLFTATLHCRTSNCRTRHVIPEVSKRVGEPHSKNLVLRDTPASAVLHSLAVENFLIPSFTKRLTIGCGIEPRMDALGLGI